MDRPPRPKWTELLETELRRFQRRLDEAEAIAKVAKAEREDFQNRFEALERDLADVTRALEETRMAIRKHLADKPECQAAFVIEALAS